MSGSLGTIKSPSALYTEEPDNTSGQIVPIDIRDVAESGAGISLSPNGVKTANYTAVLTDRGCVVPMNTASGTTAANATYTIPPFSSVAYQNGAMLGLLWVSTGVIQPAFAAGAGVTLFPATPLTIRAAGSIGWAWQYSQNVWYLLGDVG